MNDHIPFRWTSAAASDIGLVRDINEDACLDLPADGLWAVADGMGGHTLGDLASRMVVDRLSRLHPADSLGDFVAAARQQLQTANRLLREEAAIRKVRIIGSTVVALFARDCRCTCLWAGDSRLYRCRNGSLEQVTRDHNQIEEHKARGGLAAEANSHFPGRNLITRAVGALETLDLDEKTVTVIDGDMFLLCSDGLSNEVAEAEMSAALVAGNCRQAAEALVEVALQRGGSDNITAIVVRVDDPENTDRTILNPAL